MNKGTKRRERLDPNTDKGRVVYDAQVRAQKRKEDRKKVKKNS